MILKMWSKKIIFNGNNILQLRRTHKWYGWFFNNPVAIQNFVVFIFYLFFSCTLFDMYYWVWFWAVCTMVPHPKTVGGPCTKRTKVCCGKSFVGTKRKFVTFQWIFIINTDSFQLVHNFYSTYLELWKWNSR